jgi:23S rRNA pseudouridine2605 synthase
LLYDIHGRTFSAPSSASSHALTSHRTIILNQIKLQTARAALWHQTAPLLTADEATTWLDDLGICLFLPRHAQLPAPAPSFVEAVHGAASAAPPAAALKLASELAARLVEERTIVPLNLLGTYSEQADFLITPEVLPWVAAVRGDRQWNAAPGGRSSPLVIRAWQVLDREGEATAVELRELLGRELTEAAVLRALIELWTTVRAMPMWKPGQPTRWTLLKNRFPAQLTTGANTAQPTALSALLSIYLHSAIAAKAEEAEIFLSPLTARSRIREVIHGMTAARHFGSMTVGSQTLLFVAGSLAESLAEEAEAEEAAAPAAAQPGETARSAPRPPFRRAFQDTRGRKEFRDNRGSSRRPETSGREARPPFQGKRPERRGNAKAWERRPEFRRPDGPGREERPQVELPSGAPGEKRPGERPRERRPGFRMPERGARRERPSAAPSLGARGEKRPGAKPMPRREAGASGGRREVRPRVDREARERLPRFKGEPRSGEKPGQRSGPRFGPASGQRSAQKSGPPSEPRSGPRFGQRSGSPSGQRSGPATGPRFGQKGGFRPGGPKSFGGKKPEAQRFGGARPKFPPRREGAPAQGAGSNQRPRLGKPQRRDDSSRPFGRGKSVKGPGRKNFRKVNPGERNPRKNRSQEENPE